VVVFGLTVALASASTARADPTLAAAGDISSCSNDGDSRTATLAKSLDPRRVAALGDLAYPDGTLAQFRDCYRPTWGQFKWKTRPVPGNHEYDTAGAKGYRTYFDMWGHLWYAYNLGNWRVYALDSERRISDQAAFLRRDMASHPRDCYLAYWHEPRWSDGLSGDSFAVSPLWDAFANHGGDVVLSGHDHNYQRWARIAGVREFVVGTGGKGNTRLVRDRAQVESATSFGVLVLTLHPHRYEWRFRPVAGHYFHDSGWNRCRND
jgi:hypothetical protein